MTPPTKYVAYYRVSTARQGESGLGLESQRDGVQRFMGCPASHEYTDVQSGSRAKLSRRSEVFKAIDHCKRYSLPLVVYKLDRLGRDVEFLNTCVNSGITLIACDFHMLSSGDPASSKMMMTMMMAMAQYESERGSIRTRDALSVLKNRGRKLGNPRIFSDQERAHAGLSTAKRHWNDSKNTAYRVAIDMINNLSMDHSQVAVKMSDMGIGEYSKRDIDRLIKTGTMIDNYRNKSTTL